MQRLLKKIKGEQGATAVLVGVVLTVLLGFAALAVDVGYLYGVRNELQNSADAGALAGALMLFDENGTINTGANAEATRVAGLNRTGTEQVDEITVERGHWSFATRTFTPNTSTTQVDLEDRKLEDDLDLDPDFINSVRVETRRSDTPSFFARILGYDSFFVSTDAVAYLGFAGNLDQWDVDQPIVICADSISDSDGAYTCAIGRMINSGSNELNNETGGWTNYEQDPDLCQSGTNASEMSGLICGDGNPEPIYFDEGVGANGGQIQSAFDDIMDCWEANADGYGEDGIPDQPWTLNLLVVECPANNMENCATVVGLVNLSVIWINRNSDPHFNDVPRTMNNVDGRTDWSCNLDEDGEEIDGETCWADFVDHFDIQNVDGSDAPYQQKAIYFLPDCSQHEPRGETGGDNFGILAKYPKIVE